MATTDLSGRHFVFMRKFINTLFLLKQFESSFLSKSKALKNDS